MHGSALARTHWEVVCLFHAPETGSHLGLACGRRQGHEAQLFCEPVLTSASLLLVQVQPSTRTLAGAAMSTSCPSTMYPRTLSLWWYHAGGLGPPCEPHGTRGRADWGVHMSRFTVCVSWYVLDLYKLILPLWAVGLCRSCSNHILVRLPHR